ncbi:MAG: RNA methyltransferase [Gammaproteobacteria bacterium]|nr:RNA methyltransferase [Gammaproteobacteria bacterium]
MQAANIRIVLIHTSHSGNIGAVARAMKNMCLSELYLVQPRQFPSEEATARASGADDVLQKAVVCESLDQALQGCRVIYGSSARLRTIRWPQVDPRQAAEQMAAESENGSVAILFGREHSGLTNDELERCHYLLNIPANSDYSSLNIAAACQVVAYELMMASQLEPVASDIGEVIELATADEVEGLHQHLQETLIRLEYLNPQQPKQLMRRLRRLYHKAHLEKIEVNILRGILTATQKWIDKCSGDKKSVN